MSFDQIKNMENRKKCESVLKLVKAKAHQFECACKAISNFALN
jgi:hypothetical protein